MKLLIISCLLFAISSAQTVYKVGETDLFPNAAAKWDDATNFNFGKDVTNSKRDDIYQLKCSTSADCENDSVTRGPSGFYCDAGVCTMCPLGGTNDCDLPNSMITSKDTCKTDCRKFIEDGKTCTGSNVQTACNGGTDTDAQGVDISGGNGGWFCNMKPASGTLSGKCTRCSYVNTDLKGQENQCFSMPWENQNSYVTCSAACQIFERAQQEATSVDGTYYTVGVSEVETRFGSGSGGQPFCQRWGESYCTMGSAGGDFGTVFTDFDDELEGCTRRYCSADQKCMIEYVSTGTACITPRVTKDGLTVNVAGSCSEGICLIFKDSVCPPEYAVVTYNFPDCIRTSYTSGSSENQDDRSANFVGSHCDVSAVTGNDPQCRGFGPQASNVLCTTAAEYGGDDPDGLTIADGFFYPAYFNPEDKHNPENFQPNNVGWTQSGACIVGREETGYDCIIKTAGLYAYRAMEITYFEQIPYVAADTRNAMSTVLYISTSTRSLTQTVKCPQNTKCFGTMSCEWYTTGSALFPCGDVYKTCVLTTGTPTMSPIASSHGDPIIWTFNDECYDLNVDGKYLASANPKYDHKVNIVVYNDYMREIEVVNKKGEVILSINVDGEYDADNYPYAFEVYEKECPANMKKTECLDSYMSFRFDAQEFQYFVHILRHNYADPSLKEGELGYHLDIYPTPYDRFYQEGHKEKYTGLYFSNPLPEELEYCVGGADRRPSN